MRVGVRGDPERVLRIQIVEEHRPPMLKTMVMSGVGAGAGAMVEYLLDPDRGRARRARVRDKAARAAHDVNGGLGMLARDFSNRSRGVAAGARYRVAHRSVDDRVLHERVRETLGRFVAHPHAVQVLAEDGVVTLTGDVLAGEDERARRAVRRVPGVKGVEARWTVHQDAAGVPQLQGPGRPRKPVPELLQQHWTPAARVVAGTGAAAVWAMSRRLPAPLAWPLRAAGSVLAARATTNLPLRRLTGINAGPNAVEVTGAVTVEAPAAEVWRLVSDYTAFPRFMPDVRNVRRSDDGRVSHWEIAGPARTVIRFDAQETRRDEGREIAWQTTAGQLIAHAGSLRLDPLPDGRTRVQLQLTYNPVAGAIGHAVARLFGVDPDRKMSRDLERLKTFIETGSTSS